MNAPRTPFDAPSAGGHDVVSDPAHDIEPGHDWTDEGGATDEGPATQISDH